MGSRGACRAGGVAESLHAVWAKSDGDMRSFGKGQAPQDGVMEIGGMDEAYMVELLSRMARIESQPARHILDRDYLEIRRVR